MRMFNYKSLGVLLGVFALLFTACEDGNEVFDQITGAEQRGAILRTINIISDEIPIGQSDSFFGVDLEVQDQQDGDLLSALEVYLSFADNTIDPGGADKSKAEILESTISSSEFTTGEFGLPRASYMITLPEILSALGLAEADVDGGDVFSIRFELVLTDGRSFSNDDNSGTITGSYFSSPFLYNATVVCPPTPPTPGDWTVDMADAFGDGWNGASLSITIDGVENQVSIAGAAGSEVVTVPADAEVISLVFNSGDWDSEITFTVTAATGNVIYEVPDPYTITIPAGVELINYCVLNY